MKITEMKLRQLIRLIRETVEQFGDESENEAELLSHYESFVDAMSNSRYDGVDEDLVKSAWDKMFSTDIDEDVENDITNMLRADGLLNRARPPARVDDDDWF